MTEQDKAFEGKVVIGDLIDKVRTNVWISGALSGVERETICAALRVATQMVGTGPFICGHNGDHDEMGLPEYVSVCPKYGLDGAALYKKLRDYDAPGW